MGSGRGGVRLGGAREVIAGLRPEETAVMHQRGVGVTISVTSVWSGGIFLQILHKISCIKQVQVKSTSND